MNTVLILTRPKLGVGLSELGIGTCKSLLAKEFKGGKDHFRVSKFIANLNYL